jgi:PAS domain S-box-containing protein
MIEEKTESKLFAQALLGIVTPTEFLDHILRSSSEYSVLLKDLDGRIVAWNRGAELLYGYQAGEVLGKSANVLHAPEDLAAGLPTRMRGMALKHGKWEGVISRITKDQLRLTCHAILTPYENEAGEVVGFLLMSKDVGNEFRIRRT